MTEKLIYYLFIYLSSTIKFFGGPLIAAKYRLTVFESFLFTALGMMTTVLIITKYDKYLRYFIFKYIVKKKKLFSKRNRMIVRVWRTYGLFGITFLTPIIFSPIGGTLIAVSLGEKRKKIIFNMFFAACFWGTILSYVTIKLGIDLFDFLKALFI